MMCLAYHILVFGIVWLITALYIAPLFQQEWLIGTNWIRHTLVVIYKTTFVGILVGSMLSCFTGKKLTKTQIGQWSLSNWMPKWGKNEVNSWFGLFTGLPAFLVNIQAIESVAKTEKKVQQIQIEKYGDPTKSKFAAEFDFNFKWKVIDTFIYIRNPNKVEDLSNLVIKALTEWLNSSSHNYKDILELKGHLSDIQTWVEDSITPDSVDKYGVEMTEFRLVDIEIPKAQVEQQIKDAAAKKAQEEADAREMMDTEAFIKQAQDLVDKSPKDASGNPTLSFAKAMDTVLTLRGIIKSTKFSSGGGGKKGPKVVPVVTV